MRIGKRFIGPLGFLAATTVRLWMRTLDYQCAFYDPTVDLADPRCRGQKIFIFWHEHLLAPLYLRGHCNMAMLMSRHRDADILSELCHRMGFDFVRGSTFAGGTAALLELLRRSQTMSLAITPDGPRGPRRCMSQGAIYLASKSGMPLVPMGLGFDRPWRAGSWDRFAVPRPGSRARGVLGPAITIPPQLDRAGLEHYRLRLETLLNRLTLEAEAWAQSTTGKLGQQALHPRRAAPGGVTTPSGSPALRPGPATRGTP